jgi:hypothetical protein
MSKQGVRTKKQNGGNDDIEASLAIPIYMLWSYVVTRKKVMFNKKFADLSKQIDQVVYSECTSGPNCKKTRSKHNHPIFQATIHHIESLPSPDDKSIFDNEDTIEMMIKFLQAVYLPLARITMNMNDFTDDFILAVNNVVGTEYPYLVHYCQSRNNDVNFNGNNGKQAEDYYTCGRAVSAIPYACKISKVPRIVIHRTMGRADDNQDYNDPLMIATDKCSNTYVYFGSSGGSKSKRSKRSTKEVQKKYKSEP